MAVLAGIEGSMKVGGSTIGVISSFEANPAVDIHEINDMSDDWKKRIAGLAEVTGSGTCSFDPADVGILQIKNDLIKATAPGTLVFLELFLAAGIKFSGSAYVSNFRLTVDVGDAQRFAFDFVSHKAWTATNW